MVGMSNIDWRITVCPSHPSRPYWSLSHASHLDHQGGRSKPLRTTANCGLSGNHHDRIRSLQGSGPCQSRTPLGGTRCRQPSRTPSARGRREG
ncbi:hypothetical protein E2C01_043245 [Portunus trituberculatus]|uniref:Uncharacterized protein n=1 Tax=Portunus trituberculatus TaxID=210409 RepID=A0A5B7FWS5_PORTR|nr:hypothetical protein [Portunus trituberculatus]